MLRNEKDCGRHEPRNIESVLFIWLESLTQEVKTQFCTCYPVAERFLNLNSRVYAISQTCYRSNSDAACVSMKERVRWRW